MGSLDQFEILRVYSVTRDNMFHGIIRNGELEDLESLMTSNEDGRNQLAE